MIRQAGKLGLRPFVHTLHTARLMAVADRHLRSLGPAPATSFPWHDAVENATGGDWGMEGNDNQGDCVMADDAHQIMAWTANTNGLITPTTDETLAFYHEVNGPDDNGTDPTVNANYLLKTGMLVGGVRHKIDAWVPVDPQNIDNVKWAIHLFGGAKFCWNLPQSAMDQFNQGQPWDAVADDGGIAGEHDTLTVMYNANQYGTVTWAQLQQVTPAFRAKYLSMVIAVLSKDFINQQNLDAAGMSYYDLVGELHLIQETA